MTALRSILALALLAASSATLGQAKALPIALKGYDPVSYFTEPRPVKGSSALNYDFDDSRYLFSTSKNKERFAADPDRYAPQFTGLCTTGLASGMKVHADPNIFLVRDGKLYVFSSAEARDLAVSDASILRKAEEAWKGK